MRVLFLSLAMPLPANNGHKMRTLALLRALATEGHGTVLLTFALPNEMNGNLAPLREVCLDVDVVPLRLTNLTAGGDYVRRLLELPNPRPYAAGRFQSGAMQEKISQHLRTGSFEVIICDTVFSAVNLPESNTPIVIDTMDVEHVILKRFLPYEPNLAKRAYAWLECQKVRRWERLVCSRAAVSIPCSEHDQRALEELCPGLRTVVVPNVVDMDDYPLLRGQEEPCTVLYQGGMDWHPNRDAVRFFAFDILPRLRELVPSARFVVAGRNPAREFRQEFCEISEMEFTGTVPDMRPLMARAAVCVVPLRIGSGTRFKILEAGAMGKAIVSTRIGAEGLDFRDGEEILLADEPAQFARAIAELLTSAPRRNALGDGARQRVGTQYASEALRVTLRQALAILGTGSR